MKTYTPPFSVLVATPLPKLVALASELGNGLELVEAAITVKAERETINRKAAQSARRHRERQTSHSFKTAR